MNCDQIREQEIAGQYLLGQLSEAEQEAFELHYLDCGRCAAEIESLQWMRRDLLRRQAAIRAEPLRAKRPVWWWATPVAATALAVLGLALLFRPAPRRELARQEPAVAPAPLQKPASGPREERWIVLASFRPPAYQEALLRGAGGQEPFRSAMRHYQAGDYPAALAGLMQARQREPRDAGVRFYLAACRLLTQDAAGAEDEAGATIGLGETPYLEEAYWVRAKARLARRHSEEARQDLLALIALKGDWESKARGLLSRLEE
ncbi:MAG: zf-HC2 domain-containing protein [Acidobacteria bacterium]|nr:zf-HC2 domain-containing protein [Acidobacteriota bacterium]